MKSSKVKTVLSKLQNTIMTTSSVSDELWEAIDKLEVLKDEFEAEEKFLTSEALDEVIQILRRCERKV